MIADLRSTAACLRVLLVAALAVAAPAAAQHATPPAAYQRVRSVQMPRAGFIVTSRDVRGGTFTARQEGSGSGCTGQNLSPALAWRGAPAGTRSFAVTLFDPDAPTGSGFWHWIVYDVPATVASLPSGAGSAAANGAGPQLPAGAVQAATDMGQPGYAGACPPPGELHRYVITVHALRTDHLQVPPGATAAVVRFILHSQTLATASLTARYARSSAPSAGKR